MRELGIHHCDKSMTKHKEAGEIRTVYQSPVNGDETVDMKVEGIPGQYDQLPSYER